MRILFAVLLAAAMPASAQVSVGVSPLGLGVEGAAGASVGYEWNRWEIWTEPVVLLPGWTSIDGYLAGTGFRDILQVRRFFGRRGHYFFGAELRFKYQSYTYPDATIVGAAGDTIRNFAAPFYTNQVGGAVFIGQRIYFGHSPLFMEINLGPGVKYRWATQPTLPSGYRLIHAYDKLDDPVPDKDVSEWLPYLTFAVRFGLILR